MTCEELDYDWHATPTRPATLADIQAWMMEGANEVEIAGVARRSWARIGRLGKARQGPARPGEAR